jgi:Tfp pilus assembly protein PilF
LVFAVHPLTVGSVAWVSQRGVVLSTLLGLAGLYVMLRWLGVTQPDASKQTFGTLPTDPRRQLALGAALTLLAMLAHPVAAVLPALLWLLAWSRAQTPDATKRGPLIGMGVVGVIVLGLFAWIEVTRNGASGPDFRMGDNLISTIAGRAQLVCSTLVYAAYRTLIPIDNVFEQPRWALGMASVFGWASVAAVAASVAMLLRARRDALLRPAVVPLAAFALLLVPYLGLIPVAHSRYSWFVDHYAYFAAVPLIAAAVHLLSARLGPAAKGVTIAVCVVLALLSYRRAPDFVDKRATWERNLARTDGIHSIIRLADLDLRAGHFEAAIDRIDDAIARRVLDPQARLIRAEALVATGNIERANLELTAYLDDRNRPNDPDARRLLARLQIDAGRILENNERFEEAQIVFSDAFENLRRIVSMRPGDVDARVMLAGLMLDGAKRASETERASIAAAAIALFDEAVALNPNRVSTRIAYGNALLSTGMVAGAAVHWAQAARFDPGNPQVANGTGVALTINGEFDRAAVAFEAAITRDPNFADAFANFGLLRMRQEQPDDARRLFNRAVELVPNHPVARRGLAELDGRSAPTPVGP